MVRDCQLFGGANGAGRQPFADLFACAAFSVKRVGRNYRLDALAGRAMIAQPNEPPGAEAGWRVLFAFGGPWTRAAQAGRQV